MNKTEFLSALWRELDGLPPEEQRSAVQYYEDYFEDAGQENEQKVIAELGTPQAVAQAILNDYRELAAAPQGARGGSRPAQTPPRKKGISPWLLLALVIFAVPVGIPLLLLGFSLLLAFFMLALALILAAVCAPIFCAVAGAAVCWAGVLTLFSAPASGMVAIGSGLMSIAAGLLIGILFFRILTTFVPPLLRGFVHLCRRPFERRNRS